jgi:hypothetical protein
VRADREHLVDEVFADAELDILRRINVGHYALPHIPAREDAGRHSEVLTARKGCTPPPQLVARSSRTKRKRAMVESTFLHDATPKFRGFDTKQV